MNNLMHTIILILRTMFTIVLEGLYMLVSLCSKAGQRAFKILYRVISERNLYFINEHVKHALLSKLQTLTSDRRFEILMDIRRSKARYICIFILVSSLVILLRKSNILTPDKPRLGPAYRRNGISCSELNSFIYV